jgi:hypothetical protein
VPHKPSVSNATPAVGPTDVAVRARTAKIGDSRASWPITAMMIAIRCTKRRSGHRFVHATQIFTRYMRKTAPPIAILALTSAGLPLSQATSHRPSANGVRVAGILFRA